jgi:hypothetical protein
VEEAAEAALEGAGPVAVGSAATMSIFVTLWLSP